MLAVYTRNNGRFAHLMTALNAFGQSYSVKTILSSSQKMRLVCARSLLLFLRRRSSSLKMPLPSHIDVRIQLACAVILSSAAPAMARTSKYDFSDETAERIEKLDKQDVRNTDKVER